MTATERLRELLAEREEDYGHLLGTVFWKGARHGHAARDSDEGNKLIVTSYYLTPEQAIAETLGRGTCRNLIAHMQGQMPMLHCKECGCTTTLNVPSGGAGYIGETAMDWPLYCANCGRRVVAGDES